MPIAVFSINLLNAENISFCMDWEKLFKKTIFVAFFLSLILIPTVVWLTGYNVVGFNSGVWEKEFEKHDVQVEDRSGKAMTVIRYLKGHTDTLDIGLTETEQTHMADVREVMRTADKVFAISLALLIVCLGLLIYGNFNDAELLKPALFISGALLIIIPLILAFTPFDFWFELFHMPLFDSGTWVFDSSSLLVNLFPLEFFYGLAFRIFGMGLGIGVVLMIIAYFLE